MEIITIKKKHLYLYIIIALFLGVFYACTPVVPQENSNNSIMPFQAGTFPDSTRQKQQYKELRKRLAGAMADDEADEVEAISQDIKRLMGSSAGKPEYPDRVDSFISEHNIIHFKRNQLKNRLKLMLEQMDFSAIEYLSKGQKYPGAPPSVLLRKSANLITIALMAYSHNALPYMTEVFQRNAKIGLDNLIELQLPDGSFPSPDFRNTSKELGRQIEKLLKKNQIQVHNGWCVKDLGFGGFQMDTAIIGKTMLLAYREFKDKKYLKCALKAANWAANFKSVTNWNYNAFSVNLLADTYKTTGEKQYLNACIRKLKAGVLPGQTKNGRWFDSHNALFHYHIIIMNALLETFPVINKNDLNKTKLLRAIEDGLKPIMDKNISGIISHPSDILVILLNYVKIFGSDEKTALAINMNLNVIINHLDIKRPQNPFSNLNASRAIMVYLSLK